MMCDFMPHPAAWLPAAAAAATDRCTSSSGQDKWRQVYVNLAHLIDFCLNLCSALLAYYFINILQDPSSTQLSDYTEHKDTIINNTIKSKVS